MSDQPRYQTLRDYLRVIRAQRWLIVLFVVLFGGAAFAYSARQDPTYAAEASLAFNEPLQDLDLIGGGGIPRQSAEQRATTNAERAERSEVVERVIKALKLDASVSEVRGAIAVRPEARTNFVVVLAQAGSAELAARLANTFARQLRDVATEEERDRLTDALRSLRRAYRDAREDGNLQPFTRASFIDRISKLETLRDFAEPVEVARVADVPDTPASPDTVRNTVIGLLLGITLGLLAAFARDSLDVRLRGARDVQATVKLPLLGHVGDAAMGGIAAGARNGHRQLSPADLESFRIVRKNLEFLDIDRPVKTIAVTSALPEEGKSTVAAALASTYAQAGKATLLVECDLRRPSLAERLGIKRTPGLTDYLTESATPQEVLQSVPVSGGSRGDDAAGGTELVCITAGQPVPRPSDILGSRRFRDLIAEIKDAYDVVVLDTSPLLSVSDTLELLPHVDGIVMCVRAGQTRRDEAQAARAAIEHLPHPSVGLVVTGIRPGDEADYGYYSSTAYA